MTKNISLVLFGFVAGAATVWFLYPRIEPETAVESIRAQSSGTLGIPGETRSDRVVRIVGESNGEDARSGPESAATDASQDRSVPQTIGATPESAEESAVAAGQNRFAVDSANEQPGRSGAAPVAETPGDSETAPLLPDEYSALMQPPGPRMLRPDELLARIAGEERDEAWAYTMELGMNQHIAASRNLVGTVIESVQCRTTACVVAGYVEPGYENASRDVIEEMSQTGWWQLGAGTMSAMSMGREQNDVGRFVHIIPRTEGSLLGAEPSGSPESAEADTTRTIDIRRP